jgi:hypothetical protein
LRSICPSASGPPRPDQQHGPRFSEVGEGKRQSTVDPERADAVLPVPAPAVLNRRDDPVERLVPGRPAQRAGPVVRIRADQRRE